MTLAQCLELPTPPALPPLRIPNFGVLETARQSLYDLPDLSNYIMRLQDSAAAALAPLRRMLEIMEVMVAIKQCMSAIPDALLPPSPGPILDCLKALFKAFALLLQYIPPFNYIPTLIDLLDYVIIVVDEVVNLFTLLDNKITAQIATLTTAIDLGDLELAAMTDCASGESQVLILNSMDILQFTTPLISAMLSPISRLVPESILKEKLEQLATISTQLEDIEETIGQTPGVPVIGPMLDTLTLLRNLAIIVANTVAPIISGDASRQPRDFPTFVNF